MFRCVLSRHFAFSFEVDSNQRKSRQFLARNIIFVSISRIKVNFRCALCYFLCRHILAGNNRKAFHLNLLIISLLAFEMADFYTWNFALQP